MTVGERVKELRTRLGMSPVALAALAGVTDSAISQLESGMTKQPSFATGVKIARALGVTPEYLAGIEVAASMLPGSAVAAESRSPEQLEAEAERLLKSARVDRTIAALLGIVRDVPGLPPQAADRLRLLIDQHQQDTGEQAS